MFIERQLTGWECTSSQHSKWAMEIKGTNFHSTQNQCLVCTNLFIQATYKLRVHQFTTQQAGKGDKRNKFSLNTKSMLSMHKDVHWMATYKLRVHQFTTQQVGKGGKRNEFSLITQNPILSMHKQVHSKATYPLRVHQFTTQQVGKGGKRNEFSSITQNPILSMPTCLFNGNLPPEYQFTTQ